MSLDEFLFCAESEKSCSDDKSATSTSKVHYSSTSEWTFGFVSTGLFQVAEEVGVRVTELERGTGFVLPV